MTSLILNCDRSDAKLMVKAAFERANGITQYYDDGHRIIGKSGTSFHSYGESVIVEVPEMQTNKTKTMIHVSADKEVSLNVTANPERYKSIFLSELEIIREQDVNRIKSLLSENIDAKNTKEVRRASDLRDGSSTLGVIWAVMMGIFLMISIFFVSILFF